jgi:hypothetical protein
MISTEKITYQLKDSLYTDLNTALQVAEVEATECGESTIYKSTITVTYKDGEFYYKIHSSLNEVEFDSETAVNFNMKKEGDVRKALFQCMWFKKNNNLAEVNLQVGRFCFCLDSNDADPDAMYLEYQDYAQGL